MDRLYKFLNPVRVYTAVCVVQGMWLACVVDDAIKRHWGSAIAHCIALVINGVSMYNMRRTMFMSIWHSAIAHQAMHAQKAPADSV
jgi:hypothetical protein